MSFTWDRLEVCVILMVLKTAILLEVISYCTACSSDSGFIFRIKGSGMRFGWMDPPGVIWESEIVGARRVGCPEAMNVGSLGPFFVNMGTWRRRHA